jgi:C4-dicarboxylate transporter, DctM subunit
MSSAIVGLIGVGIFVLLILFLRMPIAFAMAFLGFLGFWYLSGIKGALAVLGQVPYHTVTFYEYAVVPLFVLMGLFASNSQISRGLFEACYKWLGHLPGGLAISAIGGCAFFAAICGSSMPTAAAMGVIVLPEMKRYGYDPALATGTLAAGGTLGVLIPPSIGFVIYGIITEQSIGKLLIAGILPGVLLSSLFFLTIYIQCRLKPSLGPPGPSTTWGEKAIALKGIWETVVIFVICIGGLYLGFFSPVEAAGIGCFAVLVIGLLKRTLKWQGFMDSIIETGKITTMIFAILVGAFIYGYFISVSKLPLTMANTFTESGLPKYLILAGILCMYMIIGCLMEFLSMMILTLPIIFPLVTSMGFDPIWFGVIMVIMLEMGQITPPVGINVYTIKGVAKDVPMETIFRGILPFWVAMILCLVILIVFPQIALFLPDQMYR